MHLFLKSKLLVTARLRSLIMDSEGDLGERGSLEIKDRCCCWCWKVQRRSMLYSPCPGFFRKKSCPGCIRKVYAGWKAQRDSKNQLQAFGVFWMHCCELQVHYLTTYRVAEHGDSWGLMLFCLWAKAQEGVTSHWHAFTPAALSSSSALFSWWIIDIHAIFHIVSSCFLEYSMVDMHGIFYIILVSSHSHRCTCFTIQGSPLSCHLPRPPTWRVWGHSSLEILRVWCFWISAPMLVARCDCTKLYQEFSASCCCIKDAQISQVANMETKHSIFHFFPSNLRWWTKKFLMLFFLARGDDPIRLKCKKLYKTLNPLKSSSIHWFQSFGDILSISIFLSGTSVAVGLDLSWCANGGFSSGFVPCE